MQYTPIQQIEILLQCDNATQLLDTKEFITEIQPMNDLAIKCYDSLMTLFLITTKITSNDI